jgi:RNA polymerase sigma factor (sigma-70 family)
MPAVPLVRDSQPMPTFVPPNDRPDPLSSLSSPEKAEWLARYKRPQLLAAARSAADPGLAEDALQEVLISLCTVKELPGNVDELLRYARTSIRRRAQRLGSAEAARPTSELTDASAGPSATHSPHERFEIRNDLRASLRAIARNGERTRRILFLQATGMPLREVAEELGIPYRRVRKIVEKTSRPTQEQARRFAEHDSRRRRVLAALLAKLAALPSVGKLLAGKNLLVAILATMAVGGAGIAELPQLRGGSSRPTPAAPPANAAAQPTGTPVAARLRAVPTVARTSSPVRAAHARAKPRQKPHPHVRRRTHSAAAAPRTRTSLAPPQPAPTRSAVTHQVSPCVAAGVCAP